MQPMLNYISGYGKECAYIIVESSFNDSFDEGYIFIYFVGLKNDKIIILLNCYIILQIIINKIVIILMINLNSSYRFKKCDIYTQKYLGRI